MRIVIEVEDDHVTRATVHVRGDADEPPSELLQAAALGATSAGPAPSDAGFLLPFEELPLTTFETSQPAPSDAGGAPAEPTENSATADDVA